jgi:DHA3 family tetracycline resistance protein-like MFS transporter
MALDGARPVKKSEPYQIYLLLEGVSAFLMTMIFTASSIYQVTVVGMTPLQLVLVGTTLEAAAFLFEIPTGVVADVYSRRLSVIIGMFLIGAGFLVEGSFPFFWPILFAQVLWALGYTFTSGATQAWISDEIGEVEAGKAFLRANQLGNLTALLGIACGMLIGSIRINLPIQVGGAGLALLGLYLAFRMPETGFEPARLEERSTWGDLKATFTDGLRMVRRRPALMTILSIGLIYGLYSEGFDRLWTKHILDQFSLPLAGTVQPVIWLGLIRGIGLLLATGATEIVTRRVDTASHFATARALNLITILLLVGLFTFALTGSLGLALAAYILVYVTRNVIGPVFTAWVNQKLDSRVRATVLSMSSQVDAIGQVAGGPAVGLIGNLISVRAALLTSSIILMPVLALYRLVLKQGAKSEAVDQPAFTPPT